MIPTWLFCITMAVSTQTVLAAGPDEVFKSDILFGAPFRAKVVPAPGAKLTESDPIDAKVYFTSIIDGVAPQAVFPLRFLGLVVFERLNRPVQAEAFLFQRIVGEKSYSVSRLQLGENGLLGTSGSENTILGNLAVFQEGRTTGFWLKGASPENTSLRLESRIKGDFVLGGYLEPGTYSARNLESDDPSLAQNSPLLVSGTDEPTDFTWMSRLREPEGGDFVATQVGSGVCATYPTQQKAEGRSTSKVATHIVFILKKRGEVRLLRTPSQNSKSVTLYSKKGAN